MYYNIPYETNVQTILLTQYNNAPFENLSHVERSAFLFKGTK